MNWNYVGASVIGTSHIDTNKPCQDRHVIKCKSFLRDNVLWITVSDGAGSATFSEIGAEVVTTSMAKRIERFLDAHNGSLHRIDEQLIKKWLQRTRYELLCESCVSNEVLRQFACTFIGAIISSDKTIVFQIGDGAVVLANEEQKYEVAIEPLTFEYPNMTVFLTQKNYERYLQCKFLEYSPRYVAAVTDGIQHISIRLNDNSVHVPFFRNMFEHLDRQNPGYSSALSKPLEDFLKSPQVNQRTDDDKTLVLAARQP